MIHGNNIMVANPNFHKNELRLNLNALVSNLNLVSINKQPRPIIIENVQNTNYSGLTKSLNSSIGSEYSFINENRLHMYSFLAKRKLEESKRNAKYADLVSNSIDQQAKTSDMKKSDDKRPKGNKALDLKINSAKSAIDKLNGKKENLSTHEAAVITNPNGNNKKLKILQNNSNLDVKYRELQVVLKDLIGSLEEFASTLVQCKSLCTCLARIPYAKVLLQKQMPINGLDRTQPWTKAKRKN
jgi:hypothetical protein